MTRDNIRHLLIKGQDLKWSTASCKVQNKDRSYLKLVNLTDKRETKMLIASRLPYQCQQNLGKFYGLNRKGNFNFRFSPCIFEVNHFYWPTNALNCIKLKD